MELRLDAGSFAPNPLGRRSPGVLFLEAFGRFTRGDQPSRRVVGEGRLWAVFDSRAQMMGWSAAARGSSTSAGSADYRALWSMHEAELRVDAGTSRIGWAQIGLEAGVAPGLALPAMVQCLDDALSRFGVVELTALQVTASHLQTGDRSRTRGLLSQLTWFGAGPGTGAEALVAIDRGLLPGGDAQPWVARLRALDGFPFEFVPPVAVADEHAIEVADEAPIDVPLVPAGRGIPVRLPEWSTTGAAWVLAFVVEAALADEPVPTHFAVRLTRVR